ncbi:hypothetical protein TNCV_1940471 [Trichonephila clavipes]|nr:hypothetical protein TNCV_1940471 [Trichonephila clavipes]
MMQQFKTGLSNSRVKRICKQGEGLVTFDTFDGERTGNPENIGTHFFFATAIEKNVQQTVAAAMTIVTTCNFTFRSHPPLSRKPRLSIYTGDVLVTSSTVMLRTLKNGTAAIGNHSLSEDLKSLGSGMNGKYRESQ